MLLSGHFDVLSRSIIEIGNEYRLRQETMPNLAIEDSLMVYYPWPKYYYFAHAPPGRNWPSGLKKA